MNDRFDEEQATTMSVENNTVAMLNKSEIDMQVATAHRYPRSLKRFIDEATQMVTLNESIAQQCIYSLLRWDAKANENKVIEGGSARFGEIIASAWGNCRAGARIVAEGAEFVTAQGVFHDLERNVAITYEVQRRITGANGQRFKADLIGVTANAACSIALRNAILKGIPKAFWEPLYNKARAVVAGNITTLSSKRDEALKQFAIFGISGPQVLAKLGREGIQDVTIDDLVILFGLLTAIRDGDTSPEQAFASESELSAGAATVAPAGPQAKSKSAAAEPKNDPLPPAKKPAAAAADGAPIAAAKTSQIKFIKAKADGASISEAALLAHFGLTTLDGINVKQVDDILAFIAAPTGDN